MLCRTSGAFALGVFPPHIASTAARPERTSGYAVGESGVEDIGNKVLATVAIIARPKPSERRSADRAARHILPQNGTQ